MPRQLRYLPNRCADPAEATAALATAQFRNFVVNMYAAQQEI